MRGPPLPRTIAGRLLLAALVPLAALALALAAILATVGAGASGERITAALALAIVVAALFSALVAVAIARTVTGPLAELADRAAVRATSAAGWSVHGEPAEVAALAEALRRSAAETTERAGVAESQRDRLETLLREMGDAVLIVGQDDRVTLANPAGERLLRRDGVVGGTLAEVAREHEILDAVAVARREGSATAEIERVDPRRSIRVAASRLPGSEILVTAQDLTAVRRVEIVRRDFVANVSHELRTPIASLKAMAEALEGGALEDPRAARDFVGRMHREVDELAQMVSELLALARVESGADELRPEVVAPADLVSVAASRLRPLAERAGIELRVVPADGLPAVLADPERVGQVLANLVHNAVKFTPAGGTITLGAERDPAGIRFAVRDSGAGIARDDLDRVFERFYKGERSRTGGGTGLGLSIARHVVEAHGGTIRAESEGPGRGSTFSFTLPSVT